jgi:hypothetical protein
MSHATRHALYTLTRSRSKLLNATPDKRIPYPQVRFIGGKGPEQYSISEAKEALAELQKLQ